MTRLSKLQKWILTSSKNDRPEGLILTQEIVNGFFEQRTNKAEVSVSRSIRSLMEKGLVIGFTTRLIRDPQLNNVKSPEKAMELLGGHTKLDIATLESMKFCKRVKPEDRTEQDAIDQEKKLDDLEKEHGKDALLISPAIYKFETIVAVGLTPQGKQEALMLSLANAPQLNNKTEGGTT